MKVQNQLLVASLVLAVAGVSACGDGGDSFKEGEVAAVKLETGSPIALQLPASDRRMQAQTSVTFGNDGKADLKIESIAFDSRPDRLLVAGGYLDTSCSFDADAGPTFDATGACPDNSVCWAFNSTCRSIGLPEVPFVLEEQQTRAIETIIVPGEDGLDCPVPPEGDADVPTNYCGEIVIKTNATNSTEPTIKDGEIRVFFTHIEGSGQIEVAPESVSFSGVNAGESDSRDIEVTNTHSDEPLTINQISLRDHAELFTISAAPSRPVDIAAGGASETWTLSFNPSENWDGESFGTNLEIKSTANNKPNMLVPVQVTAETTLPAIKLSPEVMRFDGDATQTVTVSNEGAANLTLRGFSVLPSTTGSMYTVEEDGVEVTGQYTKVLAPGDSQDYDVTFAPGDEPGGIGTLEVRYNYFVDDDSQNDSAQVELLGDVGDAPIGLVSPDIFTFHAASGESATRSFVIRNVGTQDLVASDVAITANVGTAEAFSTTAENGLTIAPGAMQSFELSYEADDDNQDRGGLRFGSNTAGDAMVVSLVATPGDAVSGEAVITPAFGDDSVPVNANASFSATLSTGFSEESIERATWTLLERPEGSQTFVDKVGTDATIFPDTAGSYKIALTITEGSASSQTVYEFSAQ